MQPFFSRSVCSVCSRVRGGPYVSLVSLPDYWDMGKGSSALVPFPRGSMQETKIETGGL